LRSTWPLVREVILAALPLVVALILLLPLWPPAAGAVLLAGLGGLAVAAIVATQRWRALGRIRQWLERRLAGENPRRPDLADDSMAEAIFPPVLALARRLQRQERLIAAQRRLLEQLIEALPDPVILVDRNLEVRRLNRAARTNFNVESEGVPLARVVRDPGLLTAVGAAIADGEASTVGFNPAIDRRKQFGARIEPVDLPEGERGVLITLREETEQVMIERMRSDFVANASHEIRTPLASLTGFIETLRGPARDDPDARESFLESMADETARMTRLVDDLLSLSRIELAASQPPEAMVELDGLLESVADNLRPLVARRGMTIETEADRPLPRVRGDHDQLYQLVSNLIDNAGKYGAAKTPIRVVARRLAQAPASAGPLAGRPAVEVAVADQGPGIPKEHLPRLTERFYRVDKARSRQAGGTGLGLAIVKHIVRRHQGVLLIDSELGEGSAFRVLLPIP